MRKSCPSITFPHQQDFFPVRSVTKSSTSRFSHENLVEKIKIFVQHFVPIRTALRDGVVLMSVCLHVDDITVAGESEACDFLDTIVFLRGSRLQEGNSRGT